MDWEWVKQQILKKFDEFEETYLNSEEDGVEEGFLVCIEIKEGEPKQIYPGEKCIGEICSVKVEDCKEKGIPLGFYHTHLPDLYSKEGVEISPPDILTAIFSNHKIACIGDPRGLVCYQINRNNKVLKEIKQEMDQYTKEIEGKKKIVLPTPEETSRTSVTLLGHPKVWEWERKIEKNIYDILDPLLMKKWEEE